MRDQRTSQPEEAFEALLEGASADAPSELAALAKLASALRPADVPSPDPRFRHRLRSTLLAHASAEEDVFAAAIESPRGAPAEVRSLVAVAAALEPASLPVPSPQFRYQLRSRLIAEAGRQTVLLRARTWFASVNERMRRSVRVVGATGLAAAMLASSGSALAASANALPVDALYGLKRLHESSQMAFRSDESRGYLYLRHARTRLGEVRGMVERPVTDQGPFEDTLETMDAQTLEGAKLLIEVHRRTGLTAPLTRVDAFGRAQLQDLRAIVDRLPPGAQPAARDSLAITAQVVLRAQNILAGCDPCSSEPLVAAPDGTPKNELGIGCACEQPQGDSGSSDGSSTDDRGSRGTGSTDHDGGQDDGDGTSGDDPDERPRTVPPVPGTDVDEELDTLINDLLNGLPELPEDDGSSPLPLPTTPLLEPSPTLSLPGL